jgi:hypothetical protein
MTTLVRQSPGMVTADRAGLAGVRRMGNEAEVSWMSMADPLHEEADLLVRAAKKARERGLAADAELAWWLERSVRKMWADGSGSAPELAAALTIASALTEEGPDEDATAGRPGAQAPARLSAAG